MLERYTNIQDYRLNEGSFSEVSRKDRDEILDILNLGKYTQREVISTEPFKSDIEEVINELENEADEMFSQNLISQEVNFSYAQNCHSLARKMQERRGWTTVSGYVFNKNHLNKSSIVLRSHSVTKDESGMLVELTLIFLPESFDFIEHNTGKFGIDLIAYRSSSSAA